MRCLRVFGTDTTLAADPIAPTKEVDVANPQQDTRRPNLDRVASVRFPEGEYARIEAHAKRAGLSVSALLRAAALDAVEAARATTTDDAHASSTSVTTSQSKEAGATETTMPQASVQEQSPQVSRRELAELRTGVNRVGVNWNQYVRLSNKHGAPVVAIVYSDEPGSLDAEVLNQLRAHDEQLYAELRAKAVKATARKSPAMRPVRDPKQTMTRVLDVLGDVGSVLLRVEAALGGVRRAK